MELSRRSFFKAAGAAFATSMAFEFMQPSPALAVESSSEWKLVNTEEYTNICCYCAGGCGSLCSVRDGELINLEGDPDHPINQGGLCPKGATMFQLRNVVNPETHEIEKSKVRQTKPLVRRPSQRNGNPLRGSRQFRKLPAKPRKPVMLVSSKPKKLRARPLP